MQGSLAFIKTRYNLAVAAAKVQKFPCIEQGMSNKVARAGKFVAFRGKLPRKAWQVSPIRRQVVASHAVICGNFPDFSTTSLPGKPIYRGFSGRAAREKRLSTAIAAPTALRSEPTCPTCHSGICHEFPYTIVSAAWQCQNGAGAAARRIRGTGDSMG